MINQCHLFLNLRVRLQEQKSLITTHKSTRQYCAYNRYDSIGAIFSSRFKHIGYFVPMSNALRYDFIL